MGSIDLHRIYGIPWNPWQSFIFLEAKDQQKQMLPETCVVCYSKHLFLIREEGGYSFNHYETLGFYNFRGARRKRNERQTIYSPFRCPQGS